MYPTINLQFGQSGDEVKKLQQYLISQGAQIPSGATGYFGNETKAALTEWQKQTGVDAGADFGYWGPKSIAIASKPPSNDNLDNEDTSTEDTQTNSFDDPNVDTSDSLASQKQGWVYQAAKDAGLVSSSFIDSIDGSVIAFHVRALGDGGYTVGDILNDLKRMEMSDPNFGNNSEARDLVIIDPDRTKSVYHNTVQGQKSKQMTASIIPTFDVSGWLDPATLDFGLDNMPDELFKKIVPELDETSQEFKDAVSKIKSAYFDLANQQLQADTEQAKVVADQNYEDFKQQLEEMYGIALSDDADKAWAQIEDLENTFNTRGIAGSGLEAEAIDDTLAATRQQDQRLRDEKLTKEEQQTAATLRASGSTEQINNMVSKLNAEDAANGITDPEKMRSFLWGLVPSKEILDMYDLNTLRAKYPEKSDAWLQNQRDRVLDENGNIRSTLYKNYYQGVGQNTESAESSAKSTVRQSALDEEKRIKDIYDNTPSFSGMTEGQKKQLKLDEANKLKAQEEAKGLQGEQTPTPTTPTPDTSLQDMQAKVAAANKAGQAASQITKIPYTPGTVETYFPSYKAPTANTIPTPTNVTKPQPSIQDMQAKVDAANKASEAASKVLKTPYKPGTIATYFPDYKM